MRVDVEQMQTFLYVAELGSILKASEAMETSQSTINSRIKAMGRELGYPLIQRQGRGVALTDKGELFLGYVMRTLDLLEEGIAEVGQAKKKAQQLKVAADTAMGTYVMPQVITRYRRFDPEIKAQVNVSSTSTIIDWVLNGQVDLGLIKGPVTHKGVKATLLFSSPIIPIFHRAHPLAEMSVLKPKDFLDHKLIVPNEQSAEWDQILDWFESHKVELQDKIEVDHVETMKQFVSNNLGVTFSSLITVNEELKSKKLFTTALEPPLQAAQEAYMICHRSLPLSDKASDFWEFLMKEDFES